MLEKAHANGFSRYNLSINTPFTLTVGNYIDLTVRNSTDEIAGIPVNKAQ